MPLWIRFFAKFIGFFFWITPGWLRVGFSKAFAWFWFDVVCFRRYSLLKNLTIAFPQMSKDERRAIARDSLAHLVHNLFEFLSLPWISREKAEKDFIFHNVEHYEEAKAQGKGVLHITLHMGNGDYGCAAMALRGLPVNLISKKFKVKALNEFWFGVRESMGTKFFDPHSPQTAYQIFSALKKKESVIFVLDQFMGRPFGIETTFFGKKTGTAYGLALFALKTKAPVVPVYTYRDENLRTHLVFEPAFKTSPQESQLQAEPEASREIQIANLTQKYNDWIETIVKKHPRQWMWLHRRWKTWD